MVLISGGFVVPPWLPNSETDGVPSSLGLGRAIQKACGARVVYATEANVVPIFRAGALAIGMGVVPLDILAETPEIGRVAGRVAVVPFPIDPVEASAEADRLIEQLAPKALVTIERSGPAEDGICYTGIGGDMTDSTSKIHLLVEKAADAGAFTVGCFDLGNEIGAGKISETVKRVWKHGPKVACVTETDVPFAASNSAWAAYLIAAGLAGFAGNLEVAHTEELERRLLDACLAEGMMDAATLAPTRTLSGAHIDDYGHWVELVRSVVKYIWKDFSPFELRS